MGEEAKVTVVAAVALGLWTGGSSWGKGNHEVQPDHFDLLL